MSNNFFNNILSDIHTEFQNEIEQDEQNDNSDLYEMDTIVKIIDTMLSFIIPPGIIIGAAIASVSNELKFMMIILSYLIWGIGTLSIVFQAVSGDIRDDIRETVISGITYLIALSVVLIPVAINILSIKWAFNIRIKGLTAEEYKSFKDKLSILIVIIAIIIASIIILMHLKSQGIQVIFNVDTINNIINTLYTD